MILHCILKQKYQINTCHNTIVYINFVRIAMKYTIDVVVQSDLFVNVHFLCALHKAILSTNTVSLA